MTRSLLAFPFLLVVACGGSTSSNPGTPGGSDGGSPTTGDGGGPSDAPGSLTADQACADAAKARCQRNDACSAGMLVATVYGDEATCEARLKTVCLSGLAATGAGGTPATVEACAQAIPSTPCADWLNDAPSAACLPQAGALANGAACGGSGQCASTFCGVGADAACGTCADAPKAGDPCTIAAQCGSRGGLTCANGACVAYGAASASCDRGHPCGYGLACVGAKSGASGTCQTAGASVGAACDPKSETAARCETVLGLVCDPATKKCVQQTVASAGGDCGADARCGASGTCTATGADAGSSDAGAAAGGTCVAAIADGQPCDTASGPSCLAPARCVVSGDGGTAGACALSDPSTCH
jgi:hypothetical protein